MDVCPEKYKIGIEVIDQVNPNIFELIGAIHHDIEEKAIKVEKKRLEAIGGLITYRFNLEEKWILKQNDIIGEKHLNEHHNICMYIQKINDLYETTPKEKYNQIVLVWITWLLNHLKNMDVNLTWDKKREEKEI